MDAHIHQPGLVLYVGIHSLKQPLRLDFGCCKSPGQIRKALRVEAPQLDYRLFLDGLEVDFLPTGSSIFASLLVRASSLPGQRRYSQRSFQSCICAARGGSQLSSADFTYVCSACAPPFA